MYDIWSVVTGHSRVLLIEEGEIERNNTINLRIREEPGIEKEAILLITKMKILKIESLRKSHRKMELTKVQERTV